MKGLVPILLVLFGLSATSWAVDFEEVIKNPSKFDKKRVTLVAMADVGGDRFYLYQPPKPVWSIAGRGREIYGILRTEAPVYDRFNDRWVEVTGIVDASYRGLGSDNACGLIIDRVRPVREAPAPEITTCNGSYAETRFSEVLSDPNAFEHKCVSLTGFAHVIGDAFVIYESEKAAAKPDFKKGIFVAQRLNAPDYDQFNKRWIKISGVVDMTERGSADYPSGIILERVEPGPSK